MKRTITCPKCEAKLAVFDLGKPINQKCPKCGNVFVVESEEKKDETVAAPGTDEKAPSPEKPAEKKAGDIFLKPAVTPAAKPGTPIKRDPVLAAPPAEPDAPAAGGHSLLFPVVVVGLLLLIAVMQVITKTRAETQYKTLIKHLQYIEENLVKQ